MLTESHFWFAECMQDWSPLFGPISETYTLRRFRNTLWRQTARHFLVSYSQDLESFCGIKQGTWLSSYSELYFWFFLSDLCHGISICAMSYAPNFDFHTRFTMWFNFMFFQAFANHFEDLVIRAYKRALGNKNLGDKDSVKGSALGKGFLATSGFIPGGTGLTLGPWTH